MRTGKNGMMVAIALIAVIAMAGNAAAFTEPIFGYVSTTAADGEVVVLWVENDRIDNPDNNMTVAIGHLATSDSYYFECIEPLLLGHGKNIGDPFTVTVAMFCDNPDANTYHNDTGITLTDTYGIAGPSMMPMLNLESCASEETFSKILCAGWNLISLPLTPSENSASAVLSGALYDAVYRYNATSKQWCSIESTDVMDQGTGYFVHATSDCTWEYSGTSHTSMSTELKQGLNMIGWLNCPKDIGEALSTISGDCYYVARWNAAAQKFEVYNPAAPLAFNDFTTMDQGTGYFISARQDCTLSESC